MSAAERWPRTLVGATPAHRGVALSLSPDGEEPRPVIDSHTGIPVLDIRTHPLADCGVRLAVAGEFDLATIDQFTLTAWTVLARQQPSLLALDLSGVGFLDAASVTVLIDLYQAAHRQGCRVVITAISAAAARVLCVTGVGALFAQDYPTGVLISDVAPTVADCATEGWAGHCRPSPGPGGCTRWYQPREHS